MPDKLIEFVLQIVGLAYTGIQLQENVIQIHKIVHLVTLLILYLTYVFYPVPVRM